MASLNSETRKAQKMTPEDRKKRFESISRDSNAIFYIYVKGE